MEKIRRALALTVSVIAAAAMASCGSTDGGDTNGTTTSVTTVKKVEVEDTEEIEEIAEDVQKDIIWMGTYDLNPNEAKGEDKSVEMTLFNNKGGNVIWSQVSDSEKFDKLGAAMLTSECPDIFKYEWMAFPAQVIKDMYQPVDSIVDFSDPLWADVKVNADQFVMDGKHYVAPISFSVGTVMMYDHNVVEANGLDDPYEEYLDGNWNWDTWSDMMTDFCESSPDGVQRYGINGWFQPHIIQQTGKTMVNYVDGQFVSNLMDPDIERAENLLYDLGKKGYVNTDWLGNARNALKDGNILFYCMGTWAMTGNNGPEEGDDYRIVPVPSDPNNDEKVMTADMTAYMWVRGSTASDAVKTWYECCRIANTDEQYKENGREKFMNANPAWTDEMYDVFVQASSSENRMIFDYGYGISSEMSDDNASMDGNCITRKLYEFTNKTDDAGAQYTWTSLRETYSATVDQELKTINEAVAAYTSK